jgi:gliding motility-associated-like protein
MMHCRIFILLIISLFASFSSQAQDKSNRGREFWLAYGYDYSFFHESPVNAQELALYISAEQAAVVTITITNTGYSQTLTIPANTVDATIFIPKSGPNDARTLTDGLQNKGIHIVSDVPVAVYAHVFATMVSGATMLMPVETYGFSYFSINYTQSTSGSNLPVLSPTTQNGPDWYSWFYVIASEDNTRLNITPSDTTKNGWLPGNTYTVNLNKGESYHVFGKLTAGSSQVWAASKDMTGSKVVSIPGADGNCHPVAVFSGSGGIRICRGDGGEFVHQQVFPSQAWGTRYLTYHTINNTTTDINQTNRNYYRVCVQDPTTIVRRNGVILTGLVRNFYYDLMDSTGGDYIESDKPILVSQYTMNKSQCWNIPTTTPAPPSYGDPEMFYLSPIEQGQKSVLFYTSRRSAIDYVYANIHFPTIAINSLRVDGLALPAANIVNHPNNPAYSVAVARFTGPGAQHNITCDSAFTSTVYGLGNYESYGYNVGTLINNLNHYSEIKNTFNTSGITDTFTCVKTPVRLFVKLGYQANSIHWKLSQVTGMTPNADSIINNPVPVRTELINGRTYYIYSLQQDFIFTAPGTYFIPVTFTATVIENCSQSENASVKVVVKPGPVADFTFPAINCLTDSVRFTGTSVPGTFNLVNYNWLFADNSTANTPNTVKLFPAAGNQVVRYSIIADNGCLGDTVKTVSILESPTASFSISGAICQRDSVRITDASSIPSGTIASWQWNFGDGNSTTRTNNSPFYHTYTTLGNYTIALITVAASGCKSDTAFLPVTVLPKPIAGFTTGGNVCLGDSIRFADVSTTPVGTITSWNWNFGDGNSVIRTNNSPFYHPFTTAGNYTVSLVVTGSSGCISDTFRLAVNISSKPAATFNFSGKPCIDSILTFSSSVPPGGSNPPTWQWNFGDGQTFNSSSVNTAIHSYATALSNITVKHWVSYSAGCSSDTSFVTIPVINPNPVASFTIVGDTLCERKPLTLTSNATGISTWNWDLGNGTSSTVPPFSHSYSTANTYTIKLVVSTAAGCNSLPVTQNVTINPRPAISAGPDKFIRAGNSATLDATITNPANYNFLWTPSLYLDAATILNPLSTPDVQTTYTIRAIDKTSNCIGTDDVIITPVSDLYIPSGFTPNNDGKNDKWVIPGLALYPEARVLVFNRWGEKIIDTKQYINNPWNGTYKGLIQPTGLFVYIIQLTDDKNKVIKGTVTLIR